MEPSSKSPAVAALLEHMFGRTTAIQTQTCARRPIGCERAITSEELADWSPVEQREYQITGTCRECQETLFAEPDEDEDPGPYPSQVHDPHVA